MTPACAGRTRPAADGELVTGDDPRLRGENTASAGDLLFYTG